MNKSDRRVFSDELKKVNYNLKPLVNKTTKKEFNDRENFIFIDKVCKAIEEEEGRSEQEIDFTEYGVNDNIRMVAKKVVEDLTSGINEKIVDRKIIKFLRGGTYY